MMKLNVGFWAMGFVVCVGWGECVWGDVDSDMKVMQEALGSLSRDEIMSRARRIGKAVRGAFDDCRKESMYDLSQEDEFLLGLFRRLVLPMVYGRNRKAIEKAGVDVPESFLLRARRKGLRDFAMRLKKLEVQPFLIEGLGFIPFVLFVSSLLLSFVCRFYGLWMSPSTHMFVIVCLVSFLVCVLEVVLKLYRLSRRFVYVYQQWGKNLMAQQKMAQDKMAQGMGFGGVSIGG